MPGATIAYLAHWLRHQGQPMGRDGYYVLLPYSTIDVVARAMEWVLLWLLPPLLLTIAWRRGRGDRAGSPPGATPGGIRCVAPKHSTDASGPSGSDAAAGTSAKRSPG